MQANSNADQMHLIAAIAQYVLIPIVLGIGKYIKSTVAKEIETSVSAQLEPITEKLDAHIESFQNHVTCDEKMNRDIVRIETKLDRVEDILMGRNPNSRRTGH